LHNINFISVPLLIAICLWWSCLNEKVTQKVTKIIAKSEKNALQVDKSVNKSAHNEKDAQVNVKSEQMCSEETSREKMGMSICILGTTLE